MDTTGYYSAVIIDVSSTKACLLRGGKVITIGMLVTLLWSPVSLRAHTVSDIKVINRNTWVGVIFGKNGYLLYNQGKQHFQVQVNTFIPNSKVKFDFEVYFNNYSVPPIMFVI